jgi:hypothetical protein
LEETREILNKVKILLESLGLNLSETKTKITNLNSSSALFLGTTIKRAQEYSFSKIGSSRFLRRNSKKVRLEAPITRILKKLHNAEFMSDNKAHPKFVWMSLEDRQIIHMYNSVYRGFMNYYNFAHNYDRVVSVVGRHLKESCAKLLAAKHSLGTMAKVHKIYGPNLTVTHIDKDSKPKIYSFLKPSYKLTFKFLTNSTPVIKALYGSVSIARLDNLVCALCESSYKVEMHHIRHMKDLNPKLDSLDALMAKRRRKQIPLCRECHMAHHKKLKEKSK